MKTLLGKVAIITGASSGIGRAAALLFAAEGAKVVLGARRHGLLQEVGSEIEGAGGDATHLAGDVGQELYAKALVDLALERFGRLDVSFNNAGTLGPMGDTTTISAPRFWLMP